MSRAHVTALALVNWKGVFYERYRLDRHVTALEGANGAGKTTVMIAAYVVLLPDMSRLRFTNVGESSASGGDRGIWGRLGEPGRPSYALLDIELADGNRLVAGVRLRRLGEPTVEPTAFVIEQLKKEVPLSDLLLLRSEDSDQVCDLDEVKEAVRRAGAQIEVFRSIKDYFAALFERGVTPLRLGSDEERNKLNEMLRTSMTGGISRVLTSELRNFLLKEEGGLGDVLSHMRANLDACRRTRSEVAEARVMERDISAVYEAGQAMFSSALHAARLAADESSQRVTQARVAADAAARTASALSAEVAELSAREQALDQRCLLARREHEQRASLLERTRQAAALSLTLAALDEELGQLEQHAEAARSAQALAVVDRTARRTQREQMQEAYQRAALGLAHLQQGLDELHRRAHAHRQLGRGLDEARALSGLPELTLEELPAQLARLIDQRQTLLAERGRCERERDGAAARHAEQARAFLALDVLERAARKAGAADSGEAEPLARARRALSRLAERERELAQLPALSREQRELADLATRQRSLQLRAAALGLPVGVGAARALETHSETCNAALRRSQEAQQSAELQLDATAAARARSAEQYKLLEQRAQRWQLLCAAVQRIGEGLGETLADGDDLARVRERVAEESVALTTRRQQIVADRELALRQAAELAGPGAALDPELIRLRDQLGAELLLERFDDVRDAHAVTLEARLGPLMHALVVADPAAAALELIDKPRALDTVWLVRAGVDLDNGVQSEGREDVVVQEAFGARVTRRPAQPTLGAGARAARAAELRERAEHAGNEIERIVLRLRQFAGLRRDLELLASQLDVWLAGDPAPLLAACDLESSQLAEFESTARTALTAARSELATLRAQLEELQRLLPDRVLLEPPDHAQQLAALDARLVAARAIALELSAVAEERRLLGELIDVLRPPLLQPETLPLHAARLAELDAELERGYRAAAALETVSAHRHAAEWQDAADALASQASLVPTLEAQHDRAREALAAADEAVIAGDATWEAATAVAQSAQAQRGAAAAQHERVLAERAALGGAPDEQRIAHETRALAEAAELQAELERSARTLVAELARTRERAEHTARHEAAAAAGLRVAEQQSSPQQVAWLALKTLAESAGLTPSTLALDSSSIEMAAQAESRRALLIDQLARCRGGEDAARQIRELASADTTLDAWQIAREWLRRRVPLQITQQGDPLHGLERLRDHLDVLEGRLARQESDLRSASGDVARGIDVQVRRARGQVRRLNGHLEGVRFGSIAAIRVEMRRVERMEQILHALREGDAQELLFLPSLPIDEALEEIFRRYGGGRAGGQRLLDYREYVELVVEIKRQTGDAWEAASPTRLSTGEAIGVGAALMMVVLTEWERDSNLLRARAHTGSLRFLFLDEANRLSRDNLGVLFELCKNLDLQLMIAAPEVARAEGNTTYRLVRHLGDDGREEVIVSGRRAVALAPPEAVDADSVEEPALSVSIE